tara:strand:- start:36242 stop:38296 length:2055 start_codon:yes stop_codon:yes gene_type:complete
MSLDFKPFAKLIKAKFDSMVNSGKTLLVTATESDVIWDTYINSFPEGTNPIFRERTDHDCSCCKGFIRKAGNIVTVDSNNKLVSIWDIKIDNEYQVVADALSQYVKSQAIRTEFMHYEKLIGVKFNIEVTDSGSITWNHFHIEVPSNYIKQKLAIGGLLGKATQRAEGLYRSLSELTLESAETVLELIAQNSIYRGEEHKQVVKKFIASKKKFDKIDSKVQMNYCWNLVEYGIRNTVIGSLLIELSEGKDLDGAVKSFEAKVAPANYKRPKAVVTKKMIENAENKVQELGIEDSLYRRCAVAEDIRVTNVLYADRNVKPKMGGGVFDVLKDEVPDSVKNFKKVEEVSIDKFVDNVLPNAESIELMVENKHESNLMTLMAPLDVEAPNILKWGNNFTWAYNGEVADSVRERVKNAGGRVDGVFRFSHSWNEIEPNQSLMDLHVFMPNSTQPNGNVHNNYGNDQRVGWNKRKHHDSGGSQDVDYTQPAPKGYIPVENITFPNLGKMPDGKYICKIHNWNFRGTGGKGRAEIEFGGNVYEYVYPATKNHEWVTVAEVTLKNGEFSIKHVLPESQATKKVYGINTNKFQKVSMIMNSPNHWDGEETGNKHLFFMLDGCKNDEKIRGFFNEFLGDSLTEHRKVFEVLGNKLKAEPTDNQLSGLGFSTTQKNSVLCKVTGKFNRTIKITF